MDEIDRMIDQAAGMTRSDPALARDILLKALSARPWSGRAHRLLGITESDVGNLEEATRHLEAATDLDPHNPCHWYDLGLVELRRGDVAVARDHFEYALSLRTDYVDALLNLGVCYAAMYDSVASAAACARTIDLDPIGDRRERAVQLVRSTAQDTVPREASPAPRHERKVFGIFRRKAGNRTPAELSTVSQFYACMDARAESLDDGAAAFEALLARLDEDSRSYAVTAEAYADTLFLMYRFSDARRWLARARAILPCVRALVAIPWQDVLIEAGKDKDAKRVYLQLFEELTGKKPGLLAFVRNTDDQLAPDIRRATIVCEGGIYELLRGGNIFVVRGPDGSQIVHQTYDHSDRVLGPW